jgi:hypothetical protein
LEKNIHFKGEKIMNELKLREGKMTSKEIAQWFGIKTTTYSGHL